VDAAVARPAQALAERTAGIRLALEAGVGAGAARAEQTLRTRLEVGADERSLAGRVILAAAELAERILADVEVVVLEREDVDAVPAAVAIE
jgi:hypothetical protein